MQEKLENALLSAYPYHMGHLLMYRKVTSSRLSRLVAHIGFFRLLMKGILDAYVL